MTFKTSSFKFLFFFIPSIIFSYSISILRHYNNELSENYTIQVNLFDDGYQTAKVNKYSKFRIGVFKLSLYDMYMNFKDINENKMNTTGYYNYTINNADIHVRLQGNLSIINGHILKYQNNSFYNVKYFINNNDAQYDQFRLQIRISWLRGSLLDSILPFSNLNETSSFLRYSNYINDIIYDEPISIKHEINSNKIIIEPQDSLPLCNNTSNMTGRWIKIQENSSYLSNIYFGNYTALKWLTDIFHFNNHWYWSPYHCKLQIFSTMEINKCFIKKNIHNFAFTGDSLIREHFQNILEFLLPQSALKLRKLKQNGLIQLNITSTSTLNHTLNFYFMAPHEWRNLQHRNIDIHLWNIAIHRFLVAGIYEKDIENIVKSQLYNTINKIKKSNTINCTFLYYIHPLIQFEDIRVRSLLQKKLSNNNLILHPKESIIPAFSLMTPHRLDIALKAIKTALKSKQLEYIDSESVTLSRWESSWDGVHYSLPLNRATLGRDISASINSSDNSSISYCMGDYVKSGNNLCDSIKQYSGVNKCKDGDLYYCRKVVDRNHEFDMFEGGVSRMLTMIWLNRICT